MVEDFLKFYLIDRIATPVGQSLGRRVDPMSDLSEESLRLDIMDKKRRLGLPYEDDDDYEDKLNDDGDDKTLKTMFRKYTTGALKSLPEPSFASKISDGTVFWKEATHEPSFLTKILGSAEHGAGSRLLSIGKRFARIG
jgi:hypothetical protein